MKIGWFGMDEVCNWTQTQPRHKVGLGRRNHICTKIEIKGENPDLYPDSTKRGLDLGLVTIFFNIYIYISY